jgi:hypothetical protein
MDDAFDNGGDPRTDYKYIKIRNTKAAAPHVAKIHDIYQTYAHVGGKALLCMDNNVERDALFLRGDAERLFMSDALAETCAWGELGSVFMATWTHDAQYRLS